MAMNGVCEQQMRNRYNKMMMMMMLESVLCVRN